MKVLTFIDRVSSAGTVVIARVTKADNLQVRKSITEVAENKGIFAKSFFHHVIGYKTLWQKLGYGTPILDRVVFNKMKALLGGRLKVSRVFVTKDPPSSYVLNTNVPSLKGIYIGLHLL